MEMETHTNATILRRLRRRWAAFAGSCLVALTGGAALLAGVWEPIFALRWALIASLTTTYLLGVFWRHLDTNHREAETQLLPTLEWGNRMTLLRGVLTAGLLGFLFAPLPPSWLAWIPGILYTLICLADFLDGYLARRTNHVTRLGDILDMSFDGLGVLGAVTLAVQYGQVPAWYLLVGLARYLFLAGLWLRKRRGAPIYDLPPSVNRRVIAGLQMGFLAVILWPLFSPPGTHIAALFFGLPFLAGFTLDWLHVSGVRLPKGIRAKTKERTWLSRWLPLALRIAILVVSLPILAERYHSLTTLQPQLLFLTVLETIAVLMLVFGAAGRVAAILALITLGINQVYVDLTPTQIALAMAYTTILFIGSGDFSLWKPEDNMIYRRPGERPDSQVQVRLEHSA
jgi:CDP-diacylglycerol--glycerol-3-phosphate 3-phosphatidyltransferase